jgi:hypothetical protein
MDWMLAHCLEQCETTYDAATNTDSISLNTARPEPMSPAEMRVAPDTEALASGLNEIAASFTVVTEAIGLGLARILAGGTSAELGDAPETEPHMPPTGKGDPLAGVLRNIDQVLNEEA